MKGRSAGAYDPPTLETERLRLRGWRDDDLQAYRGILRDPDVLRYWGSGIRYRAKRAVASLVAPFSSVEARRALAELDRHWQRHRLGMWAVEERTSGALIGSMGLTVLEDWTAEPANVEVGWLLARPARGRGFAVEGGRAVLAYAFEELALRRVISVALVLNHPSERVMQRLGLAYAGRIRWKGSDVVWYGLDRSAWADRRVEST